MFLTILYLVILSICFLCSLISFRLHYPLHLRVFSIFIGLSLITELVAFALPSLTGINNNMQVYNLFRLPEFFAITWYFKQLIPGRYVQKAILISWIAYPIFWIWYLFIHTSLSVWSGVLANIIGIYSIVLAVIFLYHLYQSDNIVSVKRNAEFWIAVGILFFEATSLPTLGVLLYATEMDNAQAIKLSMALPVFNIIMYLIFAYAFLCRRIKLP